MIKSVQIDKISPPRVDIWRDQWDRRSRKFFVSCVNFLEKQSEMLYNFNPTYDTLRVDVTQDVIRIQAYKYCVNLCATFMQYV